MGLFALAIAVAVLLFPHRILMIWTKIRLNQNECNLDFIGSTSNRKVSPRCVFFTSMLKSCAQLLLSHSLHCVQLQLLQKRARSDWNKKKRNEKEWSNHISLNRTLNHPISSRTSGERKTSAKNCSFLLLWLPYPHSLRIQTNDQFRCYFRSQAKIMQ